jgi:hypothetical protein
VKGMMLSLSNVAKFLGIYDDWRELREWSGLKWRQSVSCEDAFLRLYSGKEDCKHMEEWMDGVKEKLDWDC